MAKNRYSSAADRRWQRRYERIQRRKEEEKERRENYEPAYAEMIQPLYTTEEILRMIGSSMSYTMPVTRSVDEPNRNHTTFSVDALTSAFDAYYRVREAQEEADRRAKEAFLAGVEIHEETARRNDGYTADYIFMDEYTCANDDFLRGVKWNSISSISFELAEPEEPEQELEAGDSSMLDAFLGEFLAPGA